MDEQVARFALIMWAIVGIYLIGWWLVISKEAWYQFGAAVANAENTSPAQVLEMQMRLQGQIEKLEFAQNDIAKQLAEMRGSLEAMMSGYTETKHHRRATDVNALLSQKEK